MSKIGMTSGTAIALSVVATVLCYQPSRASDALLAKAQAEFTAKARDAVLQRRAAQAQARTGMVLASLPAQTQTVASPEPAAPSAPASLETSADRSIPARTPIAPIAPVQTETAPVQAAATADVVEAPVVIAKLPDVPASVSAETKTDEVQPELKPVAAETAVQNIETPKQPELPKAAATQVVTPAPQVPARAQQVASPPTNSTAPATVKIQKASREPAKTVSAKKAGPNLRQFEREFSAGRMPYDAETLRAKAPEIAAAIARYM